MSCYSSHMTQGPIPPGPRPGRISRHYLDQLLVPGNAWIKIDPAYVPARVTLESLRSTLYQAARRRGGRAATRSDETGALYVYATGCQPIRTQKPPPPGTVARRRAHLR